MTASVLIWRVGPMPHHNIYLHRFNLAESLTICTSDSVQNDKLPCMEHGRIIEELSRNREVISSLLTGMSVVDYTWKPQADKWNLLEIICHLYDEERED